MTIRDFVKLEVVSLVRLHEKFKLKNEDYIAYNIKSISQHG